MSRATWHPLVNHVPSPDELVAVATRDGRTAIGCITQANGVHANLRSVDGLTNRAYPIADTKVFVLPTPKWEFSAKEPAFKF